MRRMLVIGLTTSLIMAMAVPGVAGSNQYPDLIQLPSGFFPEGVTISGHTFYTGSLVDGAIYRGDLRTGTGGILVPGETGKVAVGMKIDNRSGDLFVSGGADGKVHVYDGDSGAPVAVVTLATGAFINDVIITEKAAYLTDSFQPQLYELPLNRNGEIAGPPRTIVLGGDFRFEPGQFNANGIEAAQGGGTLIVVNSFFGEIYAVDPSTGVADLIDLGANVINGDGLVLVGRTLYAVEGFENQIAKIHLNLSDLSGPVVDIITDPDFDVPTTAAKFGTFIYTVNAKFTTPPTPTTPYELVQVDG